MVVTDFIFGTWPRRFLAGLVGSALLALTGCHPAAQQGGPPAMPPPTVKVSHPLVRKGMIDYNEFTARVSAVNSVEIRARVNGYLQKVNFKDGAVVKKGDLLFTIDPRPYQAEVDRVQAELTRAQSQLALAGNDFKRATELFQTKAISAEELDTRNQGSAGADAALKVAQANLEVAQLNLAFCNITAPIDGRVSRAMVTEGNLVTGDGKDSTMLTTLVSLDPIYAYVDVDEASVLKYQELDREGLRKNNNGFIPAELAVGDSGVFSFKGVIDFIDNQIDPTTGTLHARAVFPNPNRELIPGQFGRLRITGSAPYDAILIPDYALSTDQDKKIVYVVGPDNTIQSREVVAGQLMDGLRIIRKGLAESDLVVLDRLMILRPGMPVQPKEEPIQPATPDATQTAADPSRS